MVSTTFEHQSWAFAVVSYLEINPYFFKYNKCHGYHRTYWDAFHRKMYCSVSNHGVYQSYHECLSKMSWEKKCILPQSNHQKLLLVWKVLVFNINMVFARFSDLNTTFIWVVIPGIITATKSAISQIFLKLIWHHLVAVLSLDILGQASFCH